MVKASLDTLRQQAEAQIEVGQWRAAKKNYQRILKQSGPQDSEHSEALMGLAKITLAEGKQRESQRHLDSLTQNHPNYLPGLIFAIRAAFQQAQFQRAQSITEQTLERFPRQVDVLKLATEVYAVSDPLRAQELLENLLAWYPEQKESWLDLVPLCLQNGHLQQAVQTLETIEKRFPELRSDPRFIDLNQPIETELISEAQTIFEHLILEQEGH